MQSSSSTTMVTVKQSYIDNLEKKIQQHLDFCKSVERCFDKQTKELRFKITDQHYQIRTMREQLNRYKRQNEVKAKKLNIKNKKLNNKNKKLHNKNKQLKNKNKKF